MWLRAAQLVEQKGLDSVISDSTTWKKFNEGWIKKEQTHDRIQDDLDIVLMQLY